MMKLLNIFLLCSMNMSGTLTLSSLNIACSGKGSRGANLVNKYSAPNCWIQASNQPMLPNYAKNSILWNNVRENKYIEMVDIGQVWTSELVSEYLCDYQRVNASTVDSVLDSTCNCGISKTLHMNASGQFVHVPTDKQMDVKFCMECKCYAHKLRWDQCKPCRRVCIEHNQYIFKCGKKCSVHACSFLTKVFHRLDLAVKHDEYLAPYYKSVLSIFLEWGVTDKLHFSLATDNIDDVKFIRHFMDVFGSLFNVGRIDFASPDMMIALQDAIEVFNAEQPSAHMSLLLKIAQESEERELKNRQELLAKIPSDINLSSFLEAIVENNRANVGSLLSTATQILYQGGLRDNAWNFALARCSVLCGNRDLTNCIKEFMQ